MGIIVEEMGRYDPYTDKFINNSTTDRIEVGTDGNLYKISVSNDNGFLSKDKLYTKADIVAMLEDLKKEMNPIKECEYQIYGKEHWNFVGKCQEVIQQKIDALKTE